jgi:short-subunit dehydrogenase
MGKALVTGAGTGIGRAIALELARRGYELALVGRRWDPLEEVSEQIRGDGGRCVIIPADLAQAEERRKICETVRDELGGLDLLVNNAGVLTAGPLNRLGSEELDQAIATNLTAPIDLTRLFLRELSRAKGRVVLVASGAAYLPLPYMSVYCATKAGLRAAGEVLRFELRGLGVQLLVAYPPFTATPMTERLTQTREFPLRVAEPEVIGRVITRAALAGRGEYYCAWSDWALDKAMRFTPRVVKAVLRWRQPQFERLIEAERRDR